MNDPAQSLEGVLNHAQENGAEETAAALCRGADGAPLPDRKQTAMFVTGFLGHRVLEWPEQPYGYVVSCERCCMVVKVPREPGDLEGIQGRGVERTCPSGVHAKPRK